LSRADHFKGCSYWSVRRHWRICKDPWRIWKQKHCDSGAATNPVGVRSSLRTTSLISGRRCCK